MASLSDNVKSYLVQAIERIKPMTKLDKREDFEYFQLSSFKMIDELSEKRFPFEKHDSKKLAVAILYTTYKESGEDFLRDSVFTDIGYVNKRDLGVLHAELAAFRTKLK